MFGVSLGNGFVALGTAQGQHLAMTRFAGVSGPQGNWKQLLKAQKWLTEVFLQRTSGPWPEC